MQKAVGSNTSTEKQEKQRSSEKEGKATEAQKSRTARKAEKLGKARQAQKNTTLNKKAITKTQYKYPSKTKPCDGAIKQRTTRIKRHDKNGSRINNSTVCSGSVNKSRNGRIRKVKQ